MVFDSGPHICMLGLSVFFRTILFKTLCIFHKIHILTKTTQCATAGFDELSTYSFHNTVQCVFCFEHVLHNFPQLLSYLATQGLAQGGFTHY